MKSIKIALAGNPNSGKTTLFNKLTGGSQRVGNWPGVTVEKKEGRYKGQKDVIIQDLPGIYSLSPYTPEEIITREYLIDERPDVIINIVDASNIERNLYLTTQLLEIGIPVVIALNMIDVVRKNGDTIDIKKLEKVFNCKVVETSATKGIGTDEVVKEALKLANDKTSQTAQHTFSQPIEEALTKIENIISDDASVKNPRWSAIKLFERDKEVLEKTALSEQKKKQIDEIIIASELREDDSSESIITAERYGFITTLIQEAVKKKNAGKLSFSDKIDKIVTNRILGLPIFVLVMFLVYYVSITTVGTMMTDWVNDVLFGEIIPPAVEGFLASVGTADWLSSLLLDGIVAGVGAVLGFLPQMFVLFICLSILEECGYMSRVAFIMDRVFRKFGLSGKSFIPILISTGCGVPGIMASRTIENESDRRMTVMTATFIPCGAKLPIIALIAGALFNGDSWVATSAYFLGIGAIIISGIMLKKTRMFAGDPAPFVLELPAYHLPKVLSVLRTSLTRTGAFVKKAGTIVLLATILVWFLSTYSWSMQAVDMDDSMLANIGNAIAPIFAPLGWGSWQATAATITGLIAKENLVGTFGVLYGFAEVAEEGTEFWPQLAAAFTPLAAYSLLVFNLLCAPCFAAMGAIRREMMSARWTLFAIGYQCVFAYAIALIIYQTGMLFTGGGFGAGTVAAIIVFGIILFLLFRRPRKPKKSSGTPAVAEATGTN